MSGPGQDVIVPRWQPDDETSSCSVCDAPFTFLNRRHHCRRCGRLVCASCSPHRITIPRQYIVRPPDPYASLQAEILGLDGQHDANLDNPALGGGETVRVCNPCVPDPNYGPPPRHQQHTQQSSPASASPPSRAQLPDQVQDATPQVAIARSRNVAAGEAQSSRSVFPDQSQSAPGHSLMGNTQSAQPRRFGDAWPGEAERETQRQRYGCNAPQPSTLYENRRPESPNHPPVPTTSSPSYPPRRTSLRAPSHTSTITPAPQPPPSNPRTARYPTRPLGTVRNEGTTILRTTSDQPPSRTATDEENECPVCGTRDYPFTPSGSSQEREQHVIDCLSSHFAFAGPSTPVRGTPTSTHPGPDRATPRARAGTLTGTGAGAGSPSASASPSSSLPHGTAVAAGPSSPAPTTSPLRPRPPHPHPPRQRMLVYHATEKDCFNAEGEAQECVICLEEFAAGEEMGRLECLCKFHRSCIRGWWDMKGVGTCPTHMLHE
ncbi:hypothetical protein M8818_006515 [Zalaria obscura]|uniref:Uncharacterized protein n=1 Tax=Zalaria obscura TaxID=2024903 RepID=A0ACC3S6L7_9PEZI